jgi:ssRNA-specific RNase YbeY (16S rRNA maturation enzyme)
MKQIVKIVVKFVIYHMPGCWHCADIMKNLQENGKTKIEELRLIFADDQTIQILDYELGKDPEADNFIAFPEIQIITERGIIPYYGMQTVNNMVESIVEQK